LHNVCVIFCPRSVRSDSVPSGPVYELDTMCCVEPSVILEIRRVRLRVSGVVRWRLHYAPSQRKEDDDPAQDTNTLSRANPVLPPLSSPCSASGSTLIAHKVCSQTPPPRNRPVRRFTPQFKHHQTLKKPTLSSYVDVYGCHRCSVHQPCQMHRQRILATPAPSRLDEMYIA